MQQTEVSMEEDAMDTSAPANFVTLPLVAMHSLATFQKTMYDVWSLHKLEFFVLVEAQ